MDAVESITKKYEKLDLVEKPKSRKRSKSSRCPREEKIDPVDKKKRKTFKAFKCSGSIYPGRHGSTPSSPSASVHLSRDAVASLEDMYENIESDKQTLQLISIIERFNSFIKSQPHNTNFKAMENWLANVGDGPEIAAKTLEIISKEIEELSKSDPESSTEKVTQVTEEVMHVLKMHLAFIGFSVAAYAGKSYLKAESTSDECKDLQLKIIETARHVKQFWREMPDEREKQWKAVGIIVKSAVCCYWYSNKPKFKKLSLWWAQRADALLQKTKEQLAEVNKDLEVSVLYKQSPSRRPRSPQELLEFNPVGIEDQVEEVKALLDLEGPEPALAVNVCGLPGIGKSTVAFSAVHSLDLSSRDMIFCMVNIDEIISDKDSHIMRLQKDIISDLGGTCNCALRDPLHGRQEIKKVFQKKGCWLLLLVDNLVHKEDIGHLLPKDWQPGDQGAKLRIIITSRQKNVNEELNIIFKQYEVKGLSDTHSKSLLTETIMQSPVLEENQVVNWDEESEIHKVAAACKGFPLVLSVFGKYLRGNRNEQSYQEALKLLVEGDFYYFPDENLGERLMFMYHEIKDVEFRDLFRDCCTNFHGIEWNHVAEIVEFGKLEDLRVRMLVSKSREGKVIVPEILQLMLKKWAKSTR